MDCGDCKSKNIILDNILGEYYCGDCGLIIEDNVADFSDLSFTFTGDEKSVRHSITSFMQVDKGLGTPLGDILKQLTHLKGKYIESPSDKVERSFQEALPSLQIAWNSLVLPTDVRISSAMLYRKCIRKNLITGRRIEGMALAAVYSACINTGIKKNVSSTAEVLGTTTEIVSAYSKIISSEVQLAVRPHVQEYIKKGIEAMALSEDVSEKAIELGNKLLSKKLEIGKHPAVVAGAIIYKTCIGTKEELSQAKVAESLKVSERSIRRVFTELLFLP